MQWQRNMQKPHLKVTGIYLSFKLNRRNRAVSYDLEMDFTLPKLKHGGNTETMWFYRAGADSTIIKTFNCSP